MSITEIHFLGDRLVDCEGNLKTLKREWLLSTPITTKAILPHSKGSAVKTVRACTEAADRIRISMAVMLQYSLEFFEQAGVRFPEADDAAAGEIRTVT